MLGNRQDDLLKKLKSCLGALKCEDKRLHELNTLKNTYCGAKGKSENTFIHPHKTIAMEVRNNNRYIPENNSFRQPLAPSNHNTSFPSHTSIAHHNSIELKRKNNDWNVDIEQKIGHRQIKRYEYGLGLGIKLQKTEKKPIYKQNNYHRKELHSKQLTKPQQGLIINKNGNKNIKQAKVINKGYRQQVEQRRKFIQGQLPNYQRSLRPSDGQYREKKVSLDYKAHVLQQHNQCPALTKLNKITQLNQKINDRIKNIINVFQDK